jgi:thiosulfate/3-mercaptopyruvate sulfurtransferase
MLLAAGAAQAQSTMWDAFRKRPTEPVVYPEILRDAAWLREHLRDRNVIVADARPAAAFHQGHIPLARHFDPYVWDGDVAGLADFLSAAGVPSVGEVVCVSDRVSPTASGALFWLLELAGHPHVSVLNGGMEAWRSAGGAIEEGGPSAPAARFFTAPDTSKICDYAYVHARFGTRGTSILDWRSAEAWATGHIPHSLPFPLGTLVTEEGLTRSGPDVRPIFEQWGPREREYVDLNDEIVVCGDLRASDAAVHPYVAARLAGIRRVRVYPEGFSGWRAHADAPIVRLIATEELRGMLHAAWGATAPDIPPPSFILLDLRGDHEFARDHLPGALSLEPGRFDAGLDQLVGDTWPGADRASIPFVVYCYGPTCTRSRNGLTLAARRGYRNLLWYKEGTEGWRSSGERTITSE